MKTTTYEGTVENGQIKLPPDADLPEHTKVIVVVPSPDSSRPLRIMSPRLANREQAADFILKVVEES